MAQTDMSISPAEKSRQILRAIELEEKQKLNEAKKTKDQVKLSKQPSSQKKAVENTVKPKSSPVVLQEAPANSGIIELSRENIVQGFIFSEVLGKPKALRRGRW